MRRNTRPKVYIRLNPTKWTIHHRAVRKRQSLRISFPPITASPNKGTIEEYGRCLCFSCQRVQFRDLPDTGPCGRKTGILRKQHFLSSQRFHESKPSGSLEADPISAATSFVHALMIIGSPAPWNTSIMYFRLYRKSARQARTGNRRVRKVLRHTVLVVI